MQPPISHLSCRISAATVWEHAPEFKRRPPELLCRVIDSTVSAVRVLLLVRAASWNHFNDYDNPNNNNRHLINIAFITSIAAGKIPRVWKAMQRATAQIKTHLRWSDRWLRVFQLTERPETTLRAAFVAHRGVWLMESERQSPLISIHWPPCTSPWLVTLIICHGSDSMSVLIDLATGAPGRRISTRLREAQRVEIKGVWSFCGKASNLRQEFRWISFTMLLPQGPPESFCRKSKDLLKDSYTGQFWV